MRKKISLHNITKTSRLRAVTSLVVVSVLSVAVVATQASAANASLSLSPSSTTVQYDASFAVSAHVDSGAEAINGVSLKLNYDQSKVQFISLDMNGGVFDSCIDKSGGGGQVLLSCAALAKSFTGRQYIAKINFKALSSAGDTTFTFANGSFVTSTASQNIWNGVASAGTVKVTAPPSNPGGGNNSGGGSNSGGSSNSDGSSNQGSSNNSGGSSSGSNNQGGGSSAPIAQPPADYDDGGNTVANTEELNSTIAIRIVDEQGKPAVGIKVTVNRQTAVTDDTGLASFIGIKPGTYKVQAKGVLGAATKNITVTEATGLAVAPQTFELQLKKGIGLATYGIIAGVVVLLVIMVLLVRRWKNNRPLRPSGPSKNNVIINGGGTDTAPVSSPFMPTVIAGADAAPIESPRTGKASVVSTDTLEQIEKKVGANKQKSDTTPSFSAQPAAGGPVGGQVIRPTQAPTDPV